MSLKELLLKNRSIRRFNQDHPITIDTLKDLVDCARLSPSARNLQPLRYVLSCENDNNARIFPFLGWAGYLVDWPGPVEGERPSAYIIICADTSIAEQVRWDDGICAHSILLAATETGLGGCMIGTINKNGLSDMLGLPKRYEICLVVALGKPNEIVTVDPVVNGDIRYYRDLDGVHHVPKRPLDDIILDI
ncbi:MAG: nitroreductase family protein [Spirochaetes bacterium]|nr:nitroreductase family protein [Spirochaetota bacterium]